MSKIIKLASEKREQANYLDFFVASTKDASEQIQSAEFFKEQIEKYLKYKSIL